MIRAALPNEARTLSEIAFQSKAYWGYSAEFMEACRAELSVTPEYLHRNRAFVLLRDDKPIAFYTLERLSSTEVELGHFFVAPEEIRRGHGRMLMDHAREQAQRAGYRVLVIQSDPNAEGFYGACGARRVGARASASILGRSLPLLEVDLGPAHSGGLPPLAAERSTR